MATIKTVTVSANIESDLPNDELRQTVEAQLRYLAEDNGVRADNLVVEVTDTEDAEVTA